MTKTEIMNGACFGYYDAVKFEECRNCKISAVCEKATSSSEVSEIRKIDKRSEKDLNRLIERFS